jgi:hypothetical protein
MMSQYTKGLSLGALVSGAVKGTPDEAKSALGGLAREVMSVVERFTGKAVTMEQATEIASRFADGAYRDETNTAKNGTVSPAPIPAALAAPSTGSSKDGTGPTEK